MSSESDAAAHTLKGGQSAQGANQPHIKVRDLTIGYGDFVVMRGLNFQVSPGEIFVIMGGSGCGKSTLLRNLIGLETPMAGEIFYREENFLEADADARLRLLRNFGVLYQNGALWSSMTLIENVSLPLAQFTELNSAEVREVASLKLALVGLKGLDQRYPSELSGGMQKRAAVARAMALDPDVLFLDEPSAGLDPVTARLLDDLIIELRDSLGATVVVVTHDLASIFTIADDSIFLDGESHTMIAQGDPKKLLTDCADPRVHRFLTRGDGNAASA
jgi:phospholipid/cholesterol/gamma-HCH transport system ATP-binding protein